MNCEKRNLFCTLDNVNPEKRDALRFAILKKMALLDEKLIPIFDEAVQMSAHFIETPICILGVRINQQYCIKSAIGLSKMGLTNKIAKSRKINIEEAFATHIIDSKSNLIIENTLIDPFFSQTNLTQHYGISSYLGTPLISSEGECIGTLEVMDFIPRQFSQKECDFLALTARWCLTEYEKNQLLCEVEKNKINDENDQDKDDLILRENNENFKKICFLKNKEKNIIHEYIKDIIDDLITTNIKELSNPLTLIIGMASVLKGGLYGQLTPKQTEYMEIIYKSGQDISILMDKILDLDDFELNEQLECSTFNLECLTQKIIASLEFFAKKQKQTIHLSMKPGQTTWVLDKQKITETIYYILITLIEGAASGGEIQVNISHQNEQIYLSFWVTHTWLGEGLSAENIEIYQKVVSIFSEDKNPAISELIHENYILLRQINESVNINLSGLLFSCYLIQLQKGKINFKGSSESGYRFIIEIPSGKP